MEINARIIWHYQCDVKSFLHYNLTIIYNIFKKHHEMEMLRSIGRLPEHREKVFSFSTPSAMLFSCHERAESLE